MSVNEAEAGLTLPARSSWTAVTVYTPSASGSTVTSHVPLLFTTPWPTTTPLASTRTRALGSPVPSKAGCRMKVMLSELVHCGPIKPATLSYVSLEVSRFKLPGTVGAVRSITNTNSSDWALRLPAASNASALSR